MKIVSSGSTLSSPEFHAKKKRQRHARLKYWFTGIIILLCLIVIASRLDSLQVSEITIEGSKTVSHEKVEEAVREQLSGHYLAVVPKSNFLAYPGQTITELLLRRFPRFSSVDLQLEGSKKLKIAVEERVPFALYCEKVENPQDSPSCYFLDASGFIFDSAPAFSGTVYFIYSSDAPINDPVGKYFLSPEEFASLTHFVSDVRWLGVEPLALEVGEIEMRLILPQGARIIWRRNSDPSQVYANLEAFLNSESVANDFGFLEKVALLDLRTDNKVFYWFKY